MTKTKDDDSDDDVSRYGVAKLMQEESDGTTSYHAYHRGGTSTRK